MKSYREFIVLGCWEHQVVATALKCLVGFGRMLASSNLLNSINKLHRVTAVTQTTVLSLPTLVHLYECESQGTFVINSDKNLMYLS